MAKGPKRTGRKTKPKPVTLARISVCEIDVDNPLYQRSHDGASANPRKIRAAYNPKESYAGYLWVKNKITEPEWVVAGIVRRSHEMCGGAGAKSMDYSREAVDGGASAQDITDAQIAAGQTLKEVESILGNRGDYVLMIDLAGEGKWPREITDNPERQRYLAMHFRTLLERIAVRWKLQTRAERLAS